MRTNPPLPLSLTPVRVAALLGLAALITLTACSRDRDIADLPQYPAALTQGEVWDVQVFRDETKLRMTNTTGSAIPASRMWINSWYSRDLDAMAIGETRTLDLGRFEDRYGTNFRAGGFFATERPDKVVLAQLEIEDRLVGLVVVGQ